MRQDAKLFFAFVFSVLFFFGACTVLETSAWARAGRGGSFGSRGSRSFSTPRMPSSPSQSSPGVNSPGRSTLPGTATQPSTGFFGRSPFMQGLAGGLAGGMLGSLLFGGMGHAAGAGTTGGGMGVLDIALIGLLLYLAYRFLKKRRNDAVAPAHYSQTGHPEAQGYPGTQTYARESHTQASDLESGLQQIRQFDPNFHEETLKDDLQDIFFRVQAAWMNRSLAGTEQVVTGEMADYLGQEFAAMKQKGQVNRLENIAVRKVEPTEAWQETGKDYITVLFTANLLDYTVDDKTGQVLEGDKLNPVKFQEFWTFCRDIGSGRWKLAAIHQVDGNH